MSSTDLSTLTAYCDMLISQQLARDAYNWAWLRICRTWARVLWLSQCVMAIQFTQTPYALD
jgi:hypothetical protein